MLLKPVLTLNVDFALIYVYFQHGWYNSWLKFLKEFNPSLHKWMHYQFTIISGEFKNAKPTDTAISHLNQNIDKGFKMQGHQLSIKKTAVFVQCCIFDESIYIGENRKINYKLFDLRKKRSWLYVIGVLFHGLLDLYTIWYRRRSDCALVCWLTSLGTIEIFVM